MVLKIHERRIKYLKIHNTDDIRIQDTLRTYYGTKNTREKNKIFKDTEYR